MFERLVPRSGPATAAELAAGERRRVGERPWVGLCMVAGLDGSVALAERSGDLSGTADRALFAALRATADVVLVGAATARIEGYGPPQRPGLRIGVVTATGNVDTTSELFTSGAGFLVMPDDGPPPPDVDGRPIDVVRAGHGTVDLALALSRLGDLVDAPTFVQVEGGPRLNGALVAAGCLDELNLAISPRVTGGDAARIVAGAPEAARDYRLVQLARADSFLFGRWVRPDPRSDGPS